MLGRRNRQDTGRGDVRHHDQPVVESTRDQLVTRMAGNLGATNQEIGWVATGYILSNVVVLPMTAFHCPCVTS